MNVIAHLSAPSASPLYKRFRSARGEHLLVVPHSRLFDLSPEVAADLDIRPEEAQRLAGALGETGAREAPLGIVVEPSPQSLSLNVSSACNLACGYCYADRGAFGGKQADRMTDATAIAAVDRLLTVADPERPVTIGFLGGEPLLNRALIHSVVDTPVAPARTVGLTCASPSPPTARLCRPPTSTCFERTLSQSR